MSTILTILIAVTATFFIIYRWRNRRFYQLSSKIPIIGGLPIIGVTHRFFRAKPEDFLPIMLEYVKEETKIGAVWFGSKMIVISNTPEQFKEIFTSPYCTNKPKLIFDAFFANSSSFCVHNPQHDVRRKLLNPSFTSLMLNRTNKYTNDAIKKFIRKMDEKCDKDAFDIYHHIAACALRSTMHGHFEFSDDSHDYKVVDGFERFKPLILMRMAQPWLAFEPFFNFSNLSKEVKASLEPIYDCIYDVIEANKHHRVSLDSRCVSIIRQLLDSKQNLSDKEIAEELFIIMYGSHETSALTISMALLLLAMHKNIQRKVLDEIQNANLDENFSMSNEETQNFPFIEMVLKESMRLFPPVATSFRETTGEIELEGYTIPKDTVICFAPLLVHRSESIWGHDAKKFRPERFEADEIRKIHPYAFVPFSFGKRMCIGYKYAMFFMKIFMANFIKNFEIDTDLTFDELKIKITPATTVLQGYPIKIKKRN